MFYWHFLLKINAFSLIYSPFIGPKYCPNGSTSYITGSPPYFSQAFFANLKADGKKFVKNTTSLFLVRQLSLRFPVWMGGNKYFFYWKDTARPVIKYFTPHSFLFSSASLPICSFVSITF